jgi:hypothetical protein
MIKTILFAFLISMSLQNSQASTEFSAVWEQELAIYKHGKTQKFETLIDPEWNTHFSDNLDMTLIGRIRLDSTTKLGPSQRKPDNYSSINGPLYADKHGEVSIREWYLDTEIASSYWRVGKQQVVWGQTDGLKVLDVINPQSYREFILDDFDDARIPLTMLNIEIPLADDSSIQVLWIPDLTYNENAELGSPYQVSSPLVSPRLPTGAVLAGLTQSKPSSLIKDSDFGLRYSMFYQGWDISYNYFYHTLDAPVYYQTQVRGLDQDEVHINVKYERSHLVGATASKAFDNFTLRSEAGYSTDSYHFIDSASANFSTQLGVHQSADLSFVIGLDWQGLENTLLSVQWFQSHLLDYNDSVIRPRNNNILSLLYQQTFENETWDIEVLSLHGFDQNDGSLQSQLGYMLESNVRLWAGADVFYGKSPSFFGQFEKANRITLGSSIGF